MFCPSRITEPSTRVPGISSCKRLSVRTRVDFPQPEGPINAVTWFGSTEREISSMARRLPYQAETLAISMLDAISASPPCGDEPRYQRKHKDESDEHEGGCPAAGNRCGVGGLGVVEDLQGHRRDGLAHAGGHELVAEG